MPCIGLTGCLLVQAELSPALARQAQNTARAEAVEDGRAAAEVIAQVIVPWVTDKASCGPAQVHAWNHAKYMTCNHHMACRLLVCGLVRSSHVRKAPTHQALGQCQRLLVGVSVSRTLTCPALGV